MEEGVEYHIQRRPRTHQGSSRISPQLGLLEIHGTIIEWKVPARPEAIKDVGKSAVHAQKAKELFTLSSPDYGLTPLPNQQMLSPSLIDSRGPRPRSGRRCTV